MNFHFHHAYVGLILIIWCILTINGIALIGKFDFYIWAIGLIVGLTLLIHDALFHARNQKRKRD